MFYIARQTVWFQAYGCLLGFDTNISGWAYHHGLGTFMEGLKEIERAWAFVAGGKGAISHKTLGEIQQVSDVLGRDLG